eukprot:SAG11_NODE_22888_length_398_cov_1.528428_1_plen_24_part_10
MLNRKMDVHGIPRVRVEYRGMIWS